MGPSTFAMDASDVGSESRTTVNAAVLPSSDTAGGVATCATPLAPLRAVPKSAMAASSRRSPPVLCSSTVVGSVAPGGSPFSSVFNATVDSADDGTPVSERSNVGLNPNASTASAASTSPDTTANRTGCRPSASPMAPNRAAFGSFFHAFDGQNTLVPSSETMAGTSVSAASTVTATAMASAGPMERKMPSVDRTSAMNATMTAPPADAMASPARSIECETAVLLSRPCRSASR